MIQSKRGLHAAGDGQTWYTLSACITLKNVLVVRKGRSAMWPLMTLPRITRTGTFRAVSKHGNQAIPSLVTFARGDSYVESHDNDRTGVLCRPVRLVSYTMTER